MTDQDPRCGNTNQVQSFAVAFQGIGRAFKTELHMKVHLVFAIAALLACWLLHVEAWGWCVVVICIGMVISAEVLNTAFEALCDKVAPEFHPLIKVAKDAAAGAVLVLAITSVVAGLIVFVPAFMWLFG